MIYLRSDRFLTFLASRNALFTSLYAHQDPNILFSDNVFIYCILKFENTFCIHFSRRFLDASIISTI